MAYSSEQPSLVSLRSRIAERTIQLVPFVGAGVSADAGFPTWKQLKDELLEKARVKTADYSDNASKHQSELKFVESSDDPWMCFDILCKLLGPTTFQTAIRNRLASSSIHEKDELYKLIWQLNPSGLISLNLDDMAVRTYPRSVEKRMVSFSGNNVANYSHILSEPLPFILNAHGIVDDASSWVLTSESRRDLLMNQAYKQFIETVFLTKTLIFIGINIQDPAIASLLRERKNHESSGVHYWITDKRDTETDAWAEARRIQIIRYDSSDNGHGDVKSILKLLHDEFQPEEPIASPPVLRDLDPNRQRSQRVYTPHELASEEPEMIRLMLNDEVSEILASETEQSYTTYSEFVLRYERAIHNASYVSSTPGDAVFGYIVEHRADRGGFAEVYKARKNSKRYAIKMLHESVLKNPAMLASFRRGINAMRILKSVNCKGVVKVVEATEMPPTVVMEWVEGINLYQAVEKELLDEWEDLLFVLSSLSRTLLRTHSLPERVLHRDIRPANIMIEFIEKRPKSITLLDFDLSWYLGSFDQTLIHEQGATGYLAPEQIHRDRGVSTRSAAVDTFGLGMTMFYSLCGIHPVAENHLHEGWVDQIKKACDNLKAPRWAATKSRFARLVFNSTKDKQYDRPDMNEVNRELNRLHSAELSDFEVSKFVALAVEEILINIDTISDSSTDYEWNEDQAYALFYGTTNNEFRIKWDVIESTVKVTYRVMLSRTIVASKKLSRVKDQLEEYYKSREWRIKISHTETFLTVVLTRGIQASDTPDRLRGLGGELDRLFFSITPSSF